MPQYEPYAMVLNNVFVGVVDLRSDQRNYFNIPDMTTAELELFTYYSDRAGHNRNIHSDRLDNNTPTRVITVDKKTRQKKKRKKIIKGRGGKPIKVPTELISTPASNGSTDPGSTTIRRGSIRFTTIKFPGAAELSEISAWLYLKLVSHKPKYMISPSGVAYPLTPFVSGDLVTGAGGSTTP